MELIDMSGAAGLVLHPVSYEFEKVTGNVWDDNWLVIAGEVVCQGHNWSFQQPSLLVDEAAEIVSWLERVATRVEPLAKADQSGTVDASLAFIEPNLAFSVLRYGHDTAAIRAHFSAEYLIPVDSAHAPEAADTPVLVEMEIPLASASSAAVIWRNQIAAFPRR